MSSGSDEAAERSASPRWKGGHCELVEARFGIYTVDFLGGQDCPFRYEARAMEVGVHVDTCGYGSAEHRIETHQSRNLS